MVVEKFVFMLANTGVFVDIFTKEGLILKDNPQQIYDYFL